MNNCGGVVDKLRLRILMSDVLSYVGLLVHSWMTGVYLFLYSC